MLWNQFNVQRVLLSGTKNVMFFFLTHKWVHLHTHTHTEHTQRCMWAGTRPRRAVSKGLYIQPGWETPVDDVSVCLCVHLLHTVQAAVRGHIITHVSLHSVHSNGLLLPVTVWPAITTKQASNKMWTFSAKSGLVVHPRLKKQNFWSKQTNLTYYIISTHLYIFMDQQTFIMSTQKVKILNE